MALTPNHGTDPRFDLSLERILDLPPEKVWAAWTRPEHVKQWFVPAPWTTADCQIDLRPGGQFLVTMRSPEGQDFPNAGCYLEIVEHRKLVWTSALVPGFRPRAGSELQFTAVITMEPHPKGTRYSVVLMHKDEADREKHGEMGFESGWGKALDQLVDHMKQI